VTSHKLSLACQFKGSEDLDASYDAVSILAYQPSAFLAFSLPLLSHHPFPLFLVVGPHRSLLSPGPPVTNKQTQLSSSAYSVCARGVPRVRGQERGKCKPKRWSPEKCSLACLTHSDGLPHHQEHAWGDIGAWGGGPEIGHFG